MGRIRLVISVDICMEVAGAPSVVPEALQFLRFGGHYGMTLAFMLLSNHLWYYARVFDAQRWWVWYTLPPRLTRPRVNRYCHSRPYTIGRFEVEG